MRLKNVVLGASVAVLLAFGGVVPAAQAAAPVSASAAVVSASAASVQLPVLAVSKVRLAKPKVKGTVRVGKKLRVSVKKSAGGKVRYHSGCVTGSGSVVRRRRRTRCGRLIWGRRSVFACR